MYPLEVSYGVSSSKNIIPMFSKNPRHWLIRFVIGCGQFWLLPRTAEETNELDMQRNQAGGAFRVCDGTKSLLPLSPRTPAPRAIMIRCGLKHAFCGKALGLDCHLGQCGRNGRGLLPQLGQIEIQQLRA